MKQIDPDRDPVEVLAEDFACRCRQGENPTVEEYASEHPTLADDIQQLFPFIAQLEAASSVTEVSQTTKVLPAEVGKSIERLGDCRMIRQIGRGGMGVVFEAYQESLGRRVAVKVLADQFVSSPMQRERFRREAQAAAKLHHTNIVPVFGVGEDDGRHYYVMQLIEGVGLDRLISCWHKQRNNGSHHSHDDHWKTVARVGQQLAEAVDYAHSQNIWHRDLKPSNVLIQEDGTAWITDFGLAKLLQEEDLTQSGDVMGTLRYMAPEQLHGDGSASSDIYSLGITLYEAAVLQPAHGQRERGNIIDQISSKGSPRPRSIDPNIPRDLETIIMKATALAPSERYASAGEIADDLARFLDDRPIHARRATVPEQLWRWSRRNPALSITSGSSLLLLLMVAVVATVGNIRTGQALAQAEVESRRAGQNLTLAIDVLNSIIENVSARGNPPALELDVDEIETASSLPNGVEATETLLHETALTPADADLLQSLLKFFDQLAANNESQLQERTAEAHRRVGDIHQRLSEWDEAKTAYREAIEIYGRLAQQEPELKIAVAQAQILRDLGSVCQKSFSSRDAWQAYDDAVELISAQPPELSQSEQLRFELAKTYVDMAWASQRMPPEILSKDAIDLARDRPSSGDRSRRDESRRRGDESQRGGRDDESRGRREDRSRDGRRNRQPPGRSRPPRPDYRQLAMNQLQELLKEDSQNPEYKFELARCYRATRHPVVGPDAESSLQTAIDILNQLVDAHPQEMRYQMELVNALRTPVLTRSSEESFPALNEDYRERLEQARALSEDLVSRFPHIHEYRALLAASLRMLGATYHQDQELEEALGYYQQATKHFDRLAEGYPSITVYQVARAKSRDRLGALHRDRQQFEDSRAVLERAIADFELFALQYDRSAFMVPELFDSLAKTLASTGQQAAADEYRDKADDLRRSIWREFNRRRGERGNDEDEKGKQNGGEESKEQSRSP